MKLRISDCRGFALEFNANSLNEFKNNLYASLNLYQSSIRPHLHVFCHDRWIDAGYGNGTKIVLHNNIFQNASYLNDIWLKCMNAESKCIEFNHSINNLLSSVIYETKKHDNEPS